MFLWSTVSSTKGKGCLTAREQLMDFSCWSKYNAWYENLSCRWRSCNPHWRWLNGCGTQENLLYAGLIVPSIVSLPSVPHYKILLGVSCNFARLWLFEQSFLCQVYASSWLIYFTIYLENKTALSENMAQEDTSTCNIGNHVCFPPKLLPDHHRSSEQRYRSARGVLQWRTFNQNCAFATNCIRCPNTFGLVISMGNCVCAAETF